MPSGKFSGYAQPGRMPAQAWSKITSPCSGPMTSEMYLSAVASHVAAVPSAGCHSESFCRATSGAPSAETSKLLSRMVAYMLLLGITEVFEVDQQCVYIHIRVRLKSYAANRTCDIDQQTWCTGALLTRSETNSVYLFFKNVKYSKFPKWGDQTSEARSDDKREARLRGNQYSRYRTRRARRPPSRAKRPTYMRSPWFVLPSSNITDRVCANAGVTRGTTRTILRHGAVCLTNVIDRICDDHANKRQPQEAQVDEWSSIVTSMPQ